MDDLVKQAMAKWPNVPDCYGWLGLDERGHWYMRDDAAQALGHFQSGVPGARGSLLKHEKLIDFIQRNYAANSAGAWFFQNGPQRVYVELAITPWVGRLNPDDSVTSHTSVQAQVTRCLCDELGRVYFQTPLGLGLLHTLDVGLAANALERGRWELENVQAASLTERFSYVISPQAAFTFSQFQEQARQAQQICHQPPLS